MKIMDIDLLGFILKSKICAVRESFLYVTIAVCPCMTCAAANLIVL